jgi:hypothetical protein
MFHGKNGPNSPDFEKKKTKFPSPQILIISSIKYLKEYKTILGFLLTFIYGM